MIELAANIDYVYMMLIAAGLGAIGGLGAELLLHRADNTGTLELPGRLKDTRLVDIGFPASILIGAIAAVAILYFFPPVVETVVTNAKGETSSTSEYDLVKLVALSLIVGSAGPAFLSTAQSRVMSALNAQKAGTAIETGKAQVGQVAETAQSTVTVAVQDAVAQHIPNAAPATVQAVADAAAASMKTALEPQVQGARDQLDVIWTPEQS